MPCVWCDWTFGCWHGGVPCRKKPPSETPITDANEVDLQNCIAVEPLANGKRRYVQKYVPAYISRGLELDMARRLAVLVTALHESVKLQSHYAELLNHYQGSRIMKFDSADAWIQRLRESGTIK